jgi:hypothetical protein
VAYLLEIRSDTGERLIAEVDPDEVDSGDLVLASPDPGRVAVRAKDTLERSLDELRPALSALLGKLREAAPSELNVQFGIKFGGETGVILAKGTAEVNLVVTMTWKDRTRE